MGNQHMNRIKNYLTVIAFLIFIFSSCSKETVINEQDRYQQQQEQFSPMQAVLSAAGQRFLEFQWKEVTNSHFNEITYSIYLNGEKVSQGMKTSKYSLINLQPGVSYSVRITATSKEGKSTEQTIQASTLAEPTVGSMYHEYSIHSYSRLIGNTTVEQLQDGSHLVAKFLSHPAYFGGENTKLIVFKIDPSGMMKWYRLFSAQQYGLHSMSELILRLQPNSSQGILLSGSFATKIDTSTGEVTSTKDFLTQLSGQTFSTAQFSPSGQLIAGCSSGALISIEPGQLTTNWFENNQQLQGQVIDLKIDSKSNLYYIFRDKNENSPKIRVNKCTPDGKFLSGFQFDGTLPGEYNYGFIMNSLVIDSKDDLYLFGHNSSYAYLRYFKFSTDGTLLKKNTTSDFFLPRHAVLKANGDIIVSGRKDGYQLATSGTVYVFDGNMNIKSKKTYDSLPYHGIHALTLNQNGSYNIFLQYVQTYSYENFNFVFIKTDQDGNI